MSVLSTLRPLVSRFGLFLFDSLPASIELIASIALLSTHRFLSQHLRCLPTSTENPMTLDVLNDDCLLLLLDTLSMPQLLQLRGVSRRLCHLIERHCLRQYKTVLFTYEEEEKTNHILAGECTTIQFHFASRQDSDREVDLSNLFFWNWNGSLFPASKHISLRSSAWPLSLPLLLPRLSSLTMEYFLVDQIDSPSDEQLAVNRRFVPYLNSNWSTTLTTLYLYIHVPASPQLDNASFAQLNQLTSLKHLFFDFLRLPEPEGASFLLPDSMPIFGQLLSFGLRYYAGSNTATLLHQLGPDLSSLSLRYVNCSGNDCIAFLRARPNYARTLKTLGVSSRNMNWELFIVATQNLTSLEVFGFSPHIPPKTDLESIFTDLSHLAHLKLIYTVPLSVDQLRTLNFRQHMPGILPQLTSIHRADIAIYNRGDPIQPSEVFDDLLPLLPRVFCRLHTLIISIAFGGRNNEALSEQLYSKVAELFPELEKLEAFYDVD